MLARRAIDCGARLGIDHALARRLVGGQRTLQVTGAVEARLGATASELDDLVVGERTIPHVSDDPVDLVVMTLHGMRLGKHLGAVDRVDLALVGDGVHQLDGERRVAPDQGETGGAQQLLPGHAAA